MSKENVRLLFYIYVRFLCAFPGHLTILFNQTEVLYFNNVKFTANQRMRVCPDRSRSSDKRIVVPVTVQQHKELRNSVVMFWLHMPP